VLSTTNIVVGVQPQLTTASTITED
jgi:hypothetical protein